MILSRLRGGLSLAVFLCLAGQAAGQLGEAAKTSGDGAKRSDPREASHQAGTTIDGTKPLGVPSEIRVGDNTKAAGIYKTDEKGLKTAEIFAPGTDCNTPPIPSKELPSMYLNGARKLPSLEKLNSTIRYSESMLQVCERRDKEKFLDLDCKRKYSAPVNISRCQADQAEIVKKCDNKAFYNTIAGCKYEISLRKWKEIRNASCKKAGDGK